MAAGYRSGLEEVVSEQIAKKGITVAYESFKIPYAVPEVVRTYTPDFPLPNGIIIETKGRWVTEDRKKHKLIKEQHPEADIRFVFSNSRSKLSKHSTTTYADYCNKNGWKYADKAVPEHWLSEPANEASLAFIQRMQECTKSKTKN